LETFACVNPVAAINWVTFFSPWPAASINLRRLTSDKARKRTAIKFISVSVRQGNEIFFGMGRGQKICGLLPLDRQIYSHCQTA